MRRPGKASASESAGLDSKVAPIFLRQNICRNFADAKQAVFGLIDRHGLVNAVLKVSVRFINLPASFMFDQWKLIGLIPIYLISRCKNKDGFGTITAGRFQKYQRPISVDSEIGERFLSCPIVAWLRSCVDDE